MNNLGRPKKAKNLKVITINIDQDVIDFIDTLAHEHGISRSEFVRGVLTFADSITAREIHKSMIILKELGDQQWIGFDPQIGRAACYGQGKGPEETLDNFLDEEFDYIKQLKNDESL